MRIGNHSTLAIAAVIGGLVLLAGCRTAGVHNIVEAPVQGTAASYQSSEVRHAIIRAGTGLGWQMKEAQPGLLIGTLHVRTHKAEVEIPYTATNYSIRYKDSVNLKYDGTTIHSSYNGWVQNLDRAIRINLNSDS